MNTEDDRDSIGRRKLKGYVNRFEMAERDSSTRRLNSEIDGIDFIIVSMDGNSKGKAELN